MKLYYVYMGGAKHSSVQQKVVNQIHAMQHNGLDAHGLFFTTEVKEETQYDQYITLIPLNSYEGNPRLFKKFFESNFYTRQVFEVLQKKQFDRLFIRHTTPTPALFKLLNHFANHTYLYIPSQVIAENYQERKHNKSHSVTSYILGWIDYFIFIFVAHYLLFWFVLPKLKGVVAFTPEFATMLKRKSFGRAKTIYNRDGADCVNVKPRKFIAQEGPIKMIFLKGSSMQQPWAGLERLVASIKARPDIPCELYITGKIYNPGNFTEPFIRLTGRLSEEELTELINRVDIGVSNLANYMIGFNETTNLKSRDYYARGLPFIQANTMPDIEGTEGVNYYLNLPNSSDLIDMDLVKDFVDRLRENLPHPEKMHVFANQHLIWDKTVGELVMIIEKDA
jgi:hypothetical protein